MLQLVLETAAAIIGTVTSVPNYPKKLKVYLNNASPFWQMIYFDNGKTYRRSCKTSDKRTAYEQAKLLYEHTLLAKYQHPTHLKQHQISAENQPIKAVTFQRCGSGLQAPPTKVKSSVGLIRGLICGWSGVGRSDLQSRRRYGRIYSMK